MFIRKSTDFPATTQHVTFLTFDVMQHTLTNRNQTGGVGLGSLLTIKIGDSKMNNGKFYLTFLSIRDQNTIFTLVEKKVGLHFMILPRLLHRGTLQSSHATFVMCQYFNKIGPREITRHNLDVENVVKAFH